MRFFDPGARPKNTDVMVPPADTSAAGGAVRELLETGLAPDDVRRLLAEEEARRAAIAAQEEQARRLALESEQARAERERRSAQRAKLEPQLRALDAEIAAAVTQYSEQRAALLAAAAQINDMIVAHGHLWGQVQATRDPGTEWRGWERPHRWNERDHGVSLYALMHAGA